MHNAENEIFNFGVHNFHGIKFNFPKNIRQHFIKSNQFEIGIYQFHQF